MSVGISIKDTVSPEIQRKIALLKDQSPFWKSVGILMHRSVLMNFKEQGRPTKWKPSRRATSQGGLRKDGVFVSGETLVDTGLLRSSIGWRIDKASAAIGVQNVGEKLKGTRFGSVKQGAPPIGSQVAYGRIHQEGIGVEKRPFILIQTQDETAIMNLLDRHLA